MIKGINSIQQALVGSVFTWAVTALGSAGVFFLNPSSRQVLDGCLGFSAGIMTAASFWSLLDPAVVVSRELYGNHGFWFVFFGFFAGAIFVFLCDALFDHGSIVNFFTKLHCQPRGRQVVDFASAERRNCYSESTVRNRKPDKAPVDSCRPEEFDKTTSLRRLFMLVIAITIHNIPEGMAVGVGFAAADRFTGYSFEKARNLAIAIGLQNFPEGLAVSLPLAAFGYSKRVSFFFGQLSGMVEPFAAVVAAYLVAVVHALLPLALGFAAGAMIFVVFDDVIPEAQSKGNRQTAVWSLIAGFAIMMAMDTLL